MVTVKRELPLESAIPANLEQLRFDHYEATPPPASETHPIVRPQVPWWTPKTKPNPGPQEEYESKFQLPPAIGPASPSFQVNSPDQTIPTTLDQFPTHLLLPEQQYKRSNGVGKEEDGPTASAWAPPGGWTTAAQEEYEVLLHELERHKKRMFEMQEQGLDESPTVPSVRRPSPPGWRKMVLPDSQTSLKNLRQHGKTRLPMTRQEAILTSSDNLHPTPPQSIIFPACGAHALPDYQMQLMLLEQQNKNRLMLARQEQDAMLTRLRQSNPNSAPNRRKQSVDSVWSTQFTPESTPGFEEPPSIQLKCELDPTPTGLVSSYASTRPSCQCAVSCQVPQDHDLQVVMLEQQKQAKMRRAQEKEGHPATSSRASNFSFQQFQREFTLKDQQNVQTLEIERQRKIKANLASAMLAPLQTSSHALQEYQMQMMFVEQQSKQMLQIQRQKQGYGATSMSSPNSNQALQKYQMQRMLLEAQNKEGLLLARQECESQKIADTESGSSAAEDSLEMEGRNNQPMWAAGRIRRNNLHNRPLVIRERPTCDD